MNKVLLGIGSVLVLTVLISAVSIIGTYNSLVGQENGLVAQYSQNQNNYSNYFNKLKEVSQVPDMQVDGLKKVYDGVMAGRYGKEGSKAIFQVIKEQNPSIDSSLYVQIQRVIEAGRNSFETDQKTLLDKMRVYQDSTEKFPNNFLAKAFGFPTDKIKNIGIVTNDETDDAFKKKKAGPIKLKE